MKLEIKATNKLKSDFAFWARVCTHTLSIKREGQSQTLAVLGPLDGLLLFLSSLVWVLRLIEGSLLVEGICPGGNLPRWVLRASLLLLVRNHPGNSLCNSRHISKAGSVLSTETKQPFFLTLNSCANVSLVQYNEMTCRWTFTGCNQIRLKAPTTVIQVNYNLT